MDTVYCRICFTNKNNLEEICDEIRETFHSLTKIHLTNSEEQSNLICHKCKSKLQSTREYIKLLAKNEMQLRNKHSVDNSLLNDDNQILAYFPQIKSEKKDKMSVKEDINSKTRAQKRSHQQTIESVYLEEFANEDSVDDAGASFTNESTGGEDVILSTELIDSIGDLEDVKAMFKLMLYEIREGKSTKAAKIDKKPKVDKVQKEQKNQKKLRVSVNETNLENYPNVESQKISNIDEYYIYINKLNMDPVYRQELIDSWKNFTNNSQQTETNAKAYNILNEIFDRDFLVSSVRWGKPFEKNKIRDDHLYLKFQDEFVDLILDVYELERSKDSIEYMAKIFKNVFNNKVRREERKMQ